MVYRAIVVEVSLDMVVNILRVVISWAAPSSRNQSDVSFATRRSVCGEVYTLQKFSHNTEVGQVYHGGRCRV